MAEAAEEEVAVPTKEDFEAALAEDKGDVEAVEVVEEAPEYTEEELSAIDKGWSPEGVEGKKNLSAEEFLDRQGLYDDIHSLKRQNKRLQGDIENINKYQEDIRADERKKVIEDLKRQKVEAMDDGDNHKVVEIEEQLADEREKAKEEIKQEKQSNEDFETWIADNSWYNDDQELRDDADIYGEIYWTKHPEKSREEVYAAVSKHIKRSYSDKFTNTSRKKPAAVEGGAAPRQAKSKTKFTAKDLPSEARSVMKTILRTSKITEEEFVKDYFDRNGK